MHSHTRSCTGRRRENGYRLAYDARPGTRIGLRYQTSGCPQIREVNLLHVQHGLEHVWTRPRHVAVLAVLIGEQKGLTVLPVSVAVLHDGDQGANAAPGPNLTVLAAGPATGRIAAAAARNQVQLALQLTDDEVSAEWERAIATATERYAHVPDPVVPEPRRKLQSDSEAGSVRICAASEGVALHVPNGFGDGRTTTEFVAGELPEDAVAIDRFVLDVWGDNVSVMRSDHGYEHLGAIPPGSYRLCRSRTERPLIYLARANDIPAEAVSDMELRIRPGSGSWSLRAMRCWRRNKDDALPWVVASPPDCGLAPGEVSCLTRAGEQWHGWRPGYRTDTLGIIEHDGVDSYRVRWETP